MPPDRPTAAELRRRALEQEAYGITNTGPAWNRYTEARRAEKSPARRILESVAQAALIIAATAVGCAPLLCYIL